MSIILRISCLLVKYIPLPKFMMFYGSYTGEVQPFPGWEHRNMEWHEILKCVSAHAIRCTVLVFFDFFFPILMKISAMVFQSLKSADAIKWKIICLIESQWHRQKQTLFIFSLVLWDIPKRMKTLAWMVHCVEAMLSILCFYEKWKFLFNP